MTVARQPIMMTIQVGYLIYIVIFNGGNLSVDKREVNAWFN